MKLWTFTFCLQFITLLGLSGAGRAVEPSAAAPPGHWPQWRGPARDNISIETGLLQKWPEGGPPLVWKTVGLGEGIASVSIAGGRIFTVGYHEGHEYLSALDEQSGERLWIQRIGPQVGESSLMRWLGQRTPTVDGDRVYVLTAYGELSCHNVAGGEPLWKKSYREDFGAKQPMFGFCDHPLVDGDRLICTPGGTLITMVALNKVTGETLWESDVLNTEAASYSAVVISEGGGVRQYVNFLSDGVFGVDAADGKLLWRYDRLASALSHFTPLLAGDEVFVGKGYRGTGGALLEIQREEDGGLRVEETRFFEKLVANRFQDSNVRVNDSFFTFGDSGIFDCVSLATGEFAWRHRLPQGAGLGSFTCAEGKLYVRYANGAVVLVEATPDQFRELGSFSIPVDDRAAGATNPVVTGRRLFLRQGQTLYCYDVQDGSLETAVQEPRTTSLSFPDVDPGESLSLAGQGTVRQRRRDPEEIDSVFVPTPHDVVEKMLALAAVKAGETVCDLGSGDGRILITAAKEYGARAVGYEIDADLVETSRRKAKEQGVDHLVTIEEKDFFTADFSESQVVTLYLTPKVVAQLVPQLKKLKAGSRIVAHEHPIPGLRPHRVVRKVSAEDNREHTLYLWTAPLE